MNSINRWVCLLLCVCIIAGIAVPAIAAETDEASPFPAQSEYAYLDLSQVDWNPEPVNTSLTRTGEDYRTWAQADSRWGSINVGNSGYTIAQIGCTVTSVTKLIIQCGLRDSSTFNVATLANWLNSNNGYTSSGSLYWGKPSACVSGFKNHGDLLDYGTYSASEYNSQILSWIRSGYHMTINVNSGHHWVAVDEAKSLTTGQVYIMDSLSGSQNADLTLASRYGTFNRIHAYTGGTTPQGTWVNLGEDFYAFIISRTAGSWLHLEAAPTDNANVGNVQVAGNGNDSSDPKQIWHFTRQDDGSYKISNEYNGLCMEGTNWGTEPLTNVCTYLDNGSACQRWYISGEEGYYVLTPQYTSSLVLDVLGGSTDPGTNVELYPPNGSSTQQFCIYDLEADGISYSPPIKPTASNVTSVLTDSNWTTITWNVSPEANKYDSRVYDLRIWNGSEVVSFDNTYASAYNLRNNSYSLHLDDGTYTIMITAKNEKYYEFYTFGNYQTVTITNHIHNFIYHVEQSPTTNEVGTLTGECTCGETIEITIPKLTTTDYDYTVITAPTCTATGTGRYTWKVTNYGSFWFDVTLPQTPHDYAAEVMPPTCMEQGYTTYTCAVCGNGYQGDYVDPLGHAWDEGVVTLPPTTEQEGIRTFTCTRCGATRTETIPKTEQNNPFVDVGETDYYYNPVMWAISHNPVITAGVDATHFGPGNPCTREQIVTFLWAANGKPEPAGTGSTFSDVSSDAWYYKPVMWAVENGYTSGMGDGSFGVGQACTRAQAMTFLWAAQGKPEPASTVSPFNDVAIGDWFCKPILWAAENGITAGIGDGLFGVYNTCTRAQIITFLYKAYT